MKWTPNPIGYDTIYRSTPKDIEHSLNAIKSAQETSKKIPKTCKDGSYHHFRYMGNMPCTGHYQCNKCWVIDPAGHWGKKPYLTY